MFLRQCSGAAPPIKGQQRMGNWKLERKKRNVVFTKEGENLGHWETLDISHTVVCTLNTSEKHLFTTEGTCLKQCTRKHSKHRVIVSGYVFQRQPGCDVFLCLGVSGLSGLGRQQNPRVSVAFVSGFRSTSNSSWPLPWGKVRCAGSTLPKEISAQLPLTSALAS